MLFADVLYPKEVLGVMGAVLGGTWDGPNPEKVIDQLIYDFVMKIADKKAYQNRVMTAVKELGCLDCVLARLNLECLLEPDQGDTIVIRRGRVGRLPGEFVPFHETPEGKALEAKKAQKDKPLELPARDTLTEPISDEEYFRRSLTTPMKFPRAPDEEKLDPNNAMCKSAERGPDGEPVFEYPDDQKVLDEIERTFYATEEVYSKSAPAPQLSAEQKIEVLEQLRRMNYKLEETRDKAFERLEKLLKKRSLEQSLVGRLAYLIVFQTFRQMNAGQLLAGISPRGMLPAGFAQ